MQSNFGFNTLSRFPLICWPFNSPKQLAIHTRKSSWDWCCLLIKLKYIFNTILNDGLEILRGIKVRRIFWLPLQSFFIRKSCSNQLGWPWTRYAWSIYEKETSQKHFYLAYCRTSVETSGKYEKNICMTWNSLQ